MKKVLIYIGGFISGIFKKVTGSNNDVIVQLPANIAITPAEIDQCIHVVNTIKSVVDNPIAVLATDLIPGTIDNVIRQKISAALPVILAGLTFSKSFLATQDKNVLVNDLLNKVKFADDVVKDALYHTLAARLIMVVSDGKVTWSEAVSLIEVYFKKVFITQ